jgi:poly(3-hydroxybutyrate) depolymerase
LKPFAPSRFASFSGRSSLQGSIATGRAPENVKPGAWHSFASFDGVRIPARYYAATSDHLGTPPPALIYAHGGPDSTAGSLSRTAFSRYQAAGFTVIAVDYRGSQNGSLEPLNDGDWGDEEVRDLRSAAEHFAAQGLIDGSRVGVMGHSHGGYMTLMALAHHADFFKAGLDMAGMTDLNLNWHLSWGERFLYQDERMPTPNENASFLNERSPLAHFEKIVAPLMIVHGTKDTNVFPVQADAFEAAVRNRASTGSSRRRDPNAVKTYEWKPDQPLPAALPELGNRLTYLKYPDGHSLTNFTADFQQKAIQFFSKVLAPQEQAAE